MDNLRYCNKYYDENSPNFLIEYRGDFKGQIDKVSYACGYIINETLGVISVSYENLDKLLNEVSSIVYVDPRSMYVLEEISPNEIGNISDIKANPYLSLNGKGVLIGMVDTGIDYLNEEFTREDGTSRIESIWDQSIVSGNDPLVDIGQTYSNEQINNALNAKKNNQDPYTIVQSKDEIGHGTKVAGIIGARGYNKDIQGIAPDSNFVVVKLLESLYNKKILEENRIKYIPTYNNSEIVAGIEYLKNYSLKVKKPMVIYVGLGTTEGSHDGGNLISKYITSVSEIRGIVMVIGCGNEGDSDGHTSGFIKNIGDIDIVELKIPVEIKIFSFSIVVKKPNKASINLVSPSGETSLFITPKIDRVERLKFILSNTDVIVRYSIPERFTGHEIIRIEFANIKPGIWKFQLRGEYIIDGEYNIWLPPKETLPPETKFLRPNPYSTLTVPSTARKVLSVAYYNYGNSLVAASGKGFNTNGIINPDIATIGMDIATTQPSGGATTLSGSSAATAVVVGASALLLQWGIVEKNDTTMYTTKIISYFYYGAERLSGYNYPNRDTGYGNLNLQNTFNVIGGTYRNKKLNESLEYYINKLFIRIPLKEEIK